MITKRSVQGRDDFRKRNNIHILKKVLFQLILVVDLIFGNENLEFQFM